MINCLSKIFFSETNSKKRIEYAQKNFSVKVINRLIAFVLFLFGANRNDISKYLNISPGTLLSFLTRTQKYKLEAFQDRRKSSTRNIQQKNEPFFDISDQKIYFKAGNLSKEIHMPSKNFLQKKVIILSLFNSRLLSSKKAADALGVSERYIWNSSSNMMKDDVNGILDKRQGQTTDYIVTPEVKAEIIQQYAIASISNQSTSAKSLSNQLKERCNIDLSERTTQYHIKKLGLEKIKHSLPILLQTLKKNLK